ncbi:glycosidase [Caloranaerobacter sp. TR13]|uniref:glycoside hydrolase family 130 protein n=1 Tax=Caloranaerobacter sp. TR13 TaxID=1302151 RepID=UPI0006D483E1|nr:glycosidase [Caloranaerobacter sp. TR13]KPU26898.1 glycosidase [Caloranaerobacter sp. TR13]
MFKLRRLSNKPILSPIKEHEWEKEAVFNCAVIYEDNKFHMFYRASNNKFILDSEKPEEENKFVSSIGYAVSDDGINFKRFDNPVFVGETEQEAWGVEDPRITKIDDTYYMLYTGFGGRSWDDFKICMAWSKDMKNWTGHRVVLDESNKDAAIFPEKINGKYVLLHRRVPDIWIAYSDDLITWTNHKIIMTPIKNTWESKKIGIAGPPIKREDGWLLIYHAVDDNHVYRLGAALLDLNDPSKVIARQSEPILEPELDWEVNGLVPNVVFSCGAVEANDNYYVYYGGADTHIGVAAIEKDKVKF